MATNEILQFAETDTGTNLLTQAEYLADAQRPIGNQPGVARSKLVNKALRQASLIAAGLAEYIADNQANNITDALTPQNIADYLQAAITGALGVTPPQFDNDTSLATTAFVQRALGSMRSLGSTNVSVALTAANIGQIYCFFGSTASQQITLPAANSVPAGAGFWIINQATVNVQIIGAGGDTVNRNTLSGLANSAGLTLWPGDSVFFASNGGTTWNTFGFATSQQFPFDKSSNGYQRLPSGVIVQWGNIATSGAGGVTLTYPIVFPGAIVSGSMQLVSSPSSAAVHPGMDFAGLSAMTVYTRDATSGAYTAVNCKYILIGY